MHTLSIIFIVAGLFFLIVAAIGVIRLPDVFSRCACRIINRLLRSLFDVSWDRFARGAGHKYVENFSGVGLAVYSKPGDLTCDNSSGSKVWFKTLEKGNPMIFSYEIPLLLLVLVTAAGAIMVKDLMSSVLLLGSYSFFLALAWAWLGAVDVAFVEAVVGAGLATVLFLLTLFGTDPKDTQFRSPS